MFQVSLYLHGKTILSTSILKVYCVHRAFINLRQRAVSRLGNRAGLHSPVS